MATGVEVARLRRDNKVLLDDIGDLRGLYNVCLRDRERFQRLFYKRPQSVATAEHMSHMTK